MSKYEKLVIKTMCHVNGKQAEDLIELKHSNKLRKSNHVTVVCS